MASLSREADGSVIDHPPAISLWAKSGIHDDLTTSTSFRPAASLRAEQGRADPLRSTRRGPPYSTVQRMAVGVEFSNSCWHSLGLRLWLLR